MMLGKYAPGDVTTTRYKGLPLLTTDSLYNRSDGSLEIFGVCISSLTSRAGNHRRSHICWYSHIHLFTSGWFSGASNASSISSFTPNRVLVYQSSIGQQSVSGRQGLVRIVTSVGAALRDSEVQMSTWMKIFLILSMTTIIVITMTTINKGVGIDEDNNDDDEAGEYVNTSRLCERPAGCLFHSS